MSNSRRVAHGVIAVLACLGLYGLPAPAEAQRSDRAAISGVVTDNQGAAVPGASVTIRNELSPPARSATIHARGPQLQFCNRSVRRRRSIWSTEQNDPRRVPSRTRRNFRRQSSG